MFTARSPSKKKRRSRSSHRSHGNRAGHQAPTPPRLCIPHEPPVLPPRPLSKAGNKREILADIAKRIPVELMREYFNYPLRSAAEVGDRC